MATMGTAANNNILNSKYLKSSPAEIPIKKPSPDEPLPDKWQAGVQTGQTGHSDERKQRKNLPFYKFSFPVYIDIRFVVTGIILPINTSFINWFIRVNTLIKIVNTQIK